MAAGAKVDPLGSCITGASVLPEKFLGMVAMRPVEPAVKLLKGRAAWLQSLIPPRASANVLGRANAIARAIVVSFMGCVLSVCDTRQPPRPFDRSLKPSLSAM